jgi:hypothetical protein
MPFTVGSLIVTVGTRPGTTDAIENETGRLSYNVTPEELFDLFGKFGPIR